LSKFLKSSLFNQRRSGIITAIQHFVNPLENLNYAFQKPRKAPLSEEEREL